MSRVGIISDTHDNLDRVRAAVAQFNRLGVKRAVHCGDVVAQFVLVEFAQLRAPLTVVFGNCDGDRGALVGRAREFAFEIGDGPLEFAVAGRRFVATHRPLEPVPDCDFYLHGHTHQPLHRAGTPAVINPGEACGWLTGRPTAAVLETDTGAVEFLNL